MATYHCQVKHGGVGKAGSHADYICREGKYENEKLKEQLVYKEHGNMPEFAKDNPKDYWEAADLYTRSNGNTYYEFEVALPNELSNEQNIELVKQLVDEEIGKDKAYSFAIHDKPAANDNTKRQIHAHVMFSIKKQDEYDRPREKFFKQYYAKEPARSGAKADNRFNGANQRGKIAIKEVRQKWEQIQNRAYEKNGINERVSCKRLEQQRLEALEKGDKAKAFELDREPQQHLGAKLTYTVLREAAKAPDKDKFYMEHSNDKVRQNFISKLYKNLAIEKNIAIKERALTLRENLENKSTEKTIRNDLVDNILKSKKDELTQNIRHENDKFIQYTNDNKREINAAIKALDEFKKKPENYLLSDKKIKQIATDLYTKNKSKVLRNEIAEHKNKSNLLTDRIAKYKLMTKENTSLDKIKSESEYIKKESQNLINNSRGLNSRIEAMKQSLQKDNAKEAVRNIESAIKAKQEVTKQRINDMQQRIDNLRTHNFVLNEMKDNAKKMSDFERNDANKGNHIKDRTKIISRISEIKDPKERLENIKHVIDGINKEQRAIYDKYKVTVRQKVNIEFARNAAKNVYTHGAYRKAVKVDKEIKSLQKQLSVSPNKEQNTRLEKLQNENTIRKEKLAVTLATDHAKNSIDRMTQSRIEKNYVLDAKQTIYKEQMSGLGEQRANLRELRSIAYQDLQHNRQQEQARSQVDRSLGAIKSGLSIEEAHSMGSISARIKGNNDRNFKDRGRGGYGD